MENYSKNMISKTFQLQRQLQDLETENSNLKVQLMEAKAIIDSLKQENQAISKRLTNYKGNSILSSDSPFITNKSLVSICENCNQEISFQNLELHTVQCLKRIVRCKVCNEPFIFSEIGPHTSQQIGNANLMIEDIINGNIESLDSRVAHGASLNSLSEDNRSTFLHISAQYGRREMVQYFLSKGLNVNAQNGFGETPLHIVCGKYKNFEMVQFLISKGGDFKITNDMGDSSMEVAKRNGFHEAVIYFQQKTQGLGRLGSSAGGTRKSKNGSKFEGKFEL
jgi:FOG: Ankyrin repeat